MERLQIKYKPIQINQSTNIIQQKNNTHHIQPNIIQIKKLSLHLRFCVQNAMKKIKKKSKTVNKTKKQHKKNKINKNQQITKLTQ